MGHIRCSVNICWINECINEDREQALGHLLPFQTALGQGRPAGPSPRAMQFSVMEPLQTLVGPESLESAGSSLHWAGTRLGVQ